MSKAIIHTGYPKTGTTWFQEIFYPNIENFYYIQTNVYRNKIITNPVFNNITDTGFLNNKKNIILCDEEFINIRDDKLYSQIPVRISKTFNNPTIIVFIRNQITLLESKYSTYIKDGGTFRFNELINHLFKIDKITQWDYYNHLKIYFDLFGKDNVHIYLFEDFTQNFNKFINSFIEKYGFSIDNNKINYSKLNISYKNMIIKTARFTNQFSNTQINNSRPDEKRFFHIPYLFKTSHFLFNKINMIIPDKRFNSESNLSKETYSKLYNYFIGGNKKLAEEFNLDLKRYNYPM